MKTLHYVVRITVPDDMLEVHVRDIIASALAAYYNTSRAKIKVTRPRGKLGALLRDRDVSAN